MKKAMSIIGKIIAAMFVVAVIGMFINIATADATAKWSGGNAFHQCDKYDCDGYYQVQYDGAYSYMHEDEMNDWAEENNLRVVRIPA